MHALGEPEGDTKGGVAGKVHGAALDLQVIAVAVQGEAPLAVDVRVAHHPGGAVLARVVHPAHGVWRLAVDEAGRERSAPVELRTELASGGARGYRGLHLLVDAVVHVHIKRCVVDGESDDAALEESAVRLTAKLNRHVGKGTVEVEFRSEAQRGRVGEIGAIRVVRAVRSCCPAPLPEGV